MPQNSETLCVATSLSAASSSGLLRFTRAKFRRLGGISPCSAAGCRLPGQPDGCSARSFLAVACTSRDQLDDHTDSRSHCSFKNSKLDASTQRRVVDFGGIDEGHLGAHTGAGLHLSAGIIPAESHTQIVSIFNAKVRPIGLVEERRSLPPANLRIHELNNYLCAWHPSLRVLITEKYIRAGRPVEPTTGCCCSCTSRKAASDVHLPGQCRQARLSLKITAPIRAPWCDTTPWRPCATWSVCLLPLIGRPHEVKGDGSRFIDGISSLAIEKVFRLDFAAKSCTHFDRPYLPCGRICPEFPRNLAHFFEIL